VVSKLGQLTKGCMPTDKLFRCITSLLIDSAFYLLWDGKMSISFLVVVIVNEYCCSLAGSNMAQGNSLGAKVLAEILLSAETT